VRIRSDNKKIKLTYSLMKMVAVVVYIALL
jgi:hypothetical protein